MGESPLWDVAEQRLHWIDVMEGNIFSTTPDARDLRVSQFPGHLTSLGLRRTAGFVLTSGTCVYLFDPTSGETDLLFDAETGAGFSFNDGKVDRQGRFVTGLVDQSLIEQGTHDQVDRIEPLG